MSLSYKINNESIESLSSNITLSPTISTSLLNNGKNLNNYKTKTTIIKNIIKSEEDDNYENDNNLNNDEIDIISSENELNEHSSVSSSSTTDLSNVLGILVNVVDNGKNNSNKEPHQQLYGNDEQHNGSEKTKILSQEDKTKLLKEQQENEKIECDHYNYARLYFILGLMFYIPLIYSSMYIREPNKNIRAFARVSLITLFLYPAILILITVTTEKFDNGKYWDPLSKQWLNRL